MQDAFFMGNSYLVTSAKDLDEMRIYYQCSRRRTGNKRSHALPVARKEAGRIAKRVFRHLYNAYFDAGEGKPASGIVTPYNDLIYK